MSYDPKCFELAEQFLQDTTVDQQKIPKLAQLIQETIEEFIEDHEQVEV